MRRATKGVLGAGVVAAAAYALWRAWRSRLPAPPAGSAPWDAAPFPFPPVPRPAAPEPARPAWVEPDRTGSCPASHRVKAKLSSGIFHAPGDANYERTQPDRCYADAGAAEADGLRPAKR
jgi:hypothetical protein